MFERDPNRFTALWLATAALLLVAAGYAGWLQGQSSTERTHREQQGTADHIQYAEDRIDEECLVLQGLALRDCIHEQIESAYDHSRAEQDLDAQQTMADFTKAMGWTAIVGLVLGAVSVYLIYATLRATQKMATDADDIGKAQVMAHLMPVSLLVGAITNQDDTGKSAYFSVQFALKNVGNTPAYRVSAAAVTDKYGKRDWSNATPSDIGQNEVSEVKLKSDIAPATLNYTEHEYRLRVYVRFETIFSRASNSADRTSNRFDYKVVRNLKGTYKAYRL